MVKQAPVKDTQCTFKPAILPQSEALRPRSVYELSRGDSLRRDSQLKLNKIRNEQEQLATATFQPVISKYAETKSKSLLNVTQNPGEFLEKYQKEQDRKKEERENIIKQREQQALEGCTFAPKTIQCPAYIKRIAKSMQIVKASRRLSNVSSGSEKPPSTWR